MVDLGENNGKPLLRFILGHWRTALLAACGTLLVGSVIVSERRADTWQQQAQAHINQGKWELAEVAIEAAKSWRWHRLDTTRLEVELLRQTDPEAAAELFAADVLPASDQAEDIYMAIRLWQNVRQTETSAALLAKLSPVQRQARTAYILEARQSVLEERWADLAQQIDQLIIYDPNDPEANLLLAQMRLRSPTALGRVQAKAALMTAIQSPNLHIQRQALSVLAQSWSLPLLDADREQMVTVLTAHPWTYPLDYLNAAQHDLAIHPQQANLIIRRARQRLAASEPLLFGEWLMAIGEYELLETHLKEYPRPEDPAWWRLSLDQAQRTENWSRLERLISDPRNPFEPYQRAIAQAYVTSPDQDPAERIARWKAAVEVAREAADQKALWSLARLGQRFDPALPLPLYAELWTDADEMPPAQQREMGMEYLNLLIIKKREAEVLEVINEMEDLPNPNFVFRNNRAFFHILAGQEVDASVAELEDLFSTGAQHPAILSSLALGYYHQGRIEPARRLLSLVPEAIRQDDPSMRLLQGMILAQIGQGEAARELLAQIEPAELFPSEQRAQAFWLERLP